MAKLFECLRSPIFAWAMNVLNLQCKEIKLKISVLPQFQLNSVRMMIDPRREYFSRPNALKLFSPGGSTIVVNFSASNRIVCEGISGLDDFIYLKRRLNALGFFFAKCSLCHVRFEAKFPDNLHVDNIFDDSSEVRKSLYHEGCFICAKADQHASLYGRSWNEVKGCLETIKKWIDLRWR